MSACALACLTLLLIPILLMTALTAQPDAPSRSKLRRLRAAVTKHKLFESAHKDDTLKVILSQLAFLTQSVDSLAAYLTAASQVCGGAAAAGFVQTLNPNAREFEPKLESWMRCDYVLQPPAQSERTDDERSDYRHWVAGRKCFLFHPNSTMHAELEHEAATVLQKSVRKHLRSRAQAQDEIAALMQKLDIVEEQILDEVFLEFVPEGCSNLQKALEALTARRRHDLQAILENALQTSGSFSDEAGSVCGICDSTPCVCGESDWSSDSEGVCRPPEGTNPDDARLEATPGDMHSARVDAGVEQLAQVQYMGFTEQQVRMAISAVGLDDPQALVQWLIQSGFQPNTEIAKGFLSQYG